MMNEAAINQSRQNAANSAGSLIAGYQPDAEQEQRWRDEQAAREALERRGQSLGVALELAMLSQDADPASLINAAKLIDGYLVNG